MIKVSLSLRRAINGSTAVSCSVPPRILMAAARKRILRPGTGRLSSPACNTAISPKQLNTRDRRFTCASCCNMSAASYRYVKSSSGTIAGSSSTKYSSMPSAINRSINEWYISSAPSSAHWVKADASSCRAA